MLVGVIGAPSSGKSTFFKAATLAEVEIENRPFVTIKPNRAIAYVRVECADKFFNTKCNPRMGFCIDSERFVPIELIDVAGLVPGAHKGEGLGLQFLNDLVQADCLIHVLDISGSTNEKGEPVEPLSHDPLNNIEFLEHELDMWYYGLLKKSWDKFARQVQMDSLELYKAVFKQFSGVGVSEEMAEEICKSKNKNLIGWSEEEIKDFAREIRIRSKPMIIAANKVDVYGATENVKRLREKYPEYTIVPCSAESELALREAAKNEMIKYIPGNKSFEIKSESLTEAQTKGLNFIQENMLNKFDNTGVQQVLNTAIFEKLNYIHVFPGGLNNLADKNGNIIPDCFLIPQKSTPLDFAFKIHTDIGKNFVKAIDVKKRIPIGKDVPLKPGDVIEIKTSK